jgi:hypothetical protein
MLSSLNWVVWIVISFEALQTASDLLILQENIGT